LLILEEELAVGFPVLVIEGSKECAEVVLGNEVALNEIATQGGDCEVQPLGARSEAGNLVLLPSLDAVLNLL